MELEKEAHEVWSHMMLRGETLFRRMEVLVGAWAAYSHE